MNADVKAKWVNALRGGEFEQCKGALRIDNSYCCLGVLSELAVRDGVISPAEALPDTDWRAERGSGKQVYAYDNETGHLSEEVARWAGLVYDDVWDDPDSAETFPEPDPCAGERPLSAWNDNHGSTFSEIADLIEVHL